MKKIVFGINNGHVPLEVLRTHTQKNFQILLSLFSLSVKQAGSVTDACDSSQGSYTIQTL